MYIVCVCYSVVEYIYPCSNTLRFWQSTLPIRQPIKLSRASGIVSEHQYLDFILQVKGKNSTHLDVF